MKLVLLCVTLLSSAAFASPAANCVKDYEIAARTILVNPSLNKIPAALRFQTCKLAEKQWFLALQVGSEAALSECAAPIEQRNAMYNDMHSRRLSLEEFTDDCSYAGLL